MATIQSSIRITDGMTPALQSMNRALNIVLNSFEAMQRVSGKSVDTKSIQTARTELAKAQTQFNNIENEIRQNTTAQNQFNNSVRNGTSAASALWSKLKGVAAAYLGINAVGGIINTADQMTMTTARLDLINDGLQTTAELNDKIYQAAMRSRGSVTATADAVAKLAARAGNIFKSNDETIAFAETLNKMFVVAGTSQQEMASATLQLTQALGSGVLRGEEFNAVFEAAPNVMQAVADYMNVPIGKLRELAKDGKISAQVVKNAMFSAADKVNEQFASMPYTWAQVWTTIKNYTLKVTRPILEAISKLTSNERFIKFAGGVGNAIATIANGLTKAMNLIGPVLGSIFDKVSEIYNFIVTNWSFIGPIVLGIAGAIAILKLGMMAYHGILLLVKGAQIAFAIVSGIVKVALGLTSAATAGATMAQLGFNAALWSCPLTWIVLAIIAVIVVIYLAVAAINHFAGTSISATGIIAGTFKFIYAIIYNSISQIWDVILSFAEFFVNVWKDPKRAFIELALNIAQTMIDTMRACQGVVDAVINAVIDGIEWAINKCIDGINWLLSKLPDKAKEFLGVSGTVSQVDLSGGKNSFGKGLDKYQAAIDSIKNSLGEDPEGWSSLKEKYSLGRKDLSQAFTEGYNWGQGVDDKVSNAIDKVKNMLNGNGNVNDIVKALSGDLGDNPALDKIKKDTGSIASDTSSLAASDEELSYMRDMAEREAINRYTMASVKIDMNNNNNIKSDLDLNQIVGHLQRKIYEGVVATANGVHV